MRESNLCERLLSLCEKWGIPLGAFLTHDDVCREMREFVEEIGPDAAKSLADCLIRQGFSRSPSLLKSI